MRDGSSRRALERAGVSPITRDEHDVASTTLAQPLEVLEDGLKVGSATGGEHCDAGFHLTDFTVNGTAREACEEIDQPRRRANPRRRSVHPEHEHDLRREWTQRRGEWPVRRTTQRESHLAYDRRQRVSERDR